MLVGLPNDPDVVDNYLVALAKVADASEELVERLLHVHNSSRYQAVWVLAQQHCGPYDGPSYANELKALQDALANLRRREGEGTIPIAEQPAPQQRWRAV